MDALTLGAVAVGLAMDALAVAVAIGLVTKERACRCAFRVGLHFGVFQAGMTLLGYFAASTVSGRVREAEGWIAASLLWLIGAHMLYEACFGKHAVRKDGPGGTRATPAAGGGEGAVVVGSGEADSCEFAHGWPLLGLSLATSIDAFGAGASFAFLGASTVWLAAGVIGAVAAVLPGAGVLVAQRLAERTGERFARAAEFAGGAVLIGIGVKAVLWGG